MANLGLRELQFCRAAEVGWAPVSEFPASASQPITSIWVNGTAAPVEQSGYASFPNEPLAAPDWLVQLAAAPEVSEIDTEFEGSCLLTSGTLTARYLSPQTVTTYAQVTFKGISYEQAVVEASGLGYRLADPCYEAASPRPAWHGMGQVGSYARTHSLVLAVTDANSTQWQAQTRQLQGFVSLTAPYSASC
jgi:hypothetical protein